MLKKLFSFIMTMMIIFGVNHSVQAAEYTGDKLNIAVILDTPSGMFSEPEKVYATVKESLDNIFSNSTQYKIMSIEETNSYVQIYREENDLTTTVNTGYYGAVNQDLMLKKRRY